MLCSCISTQAPPLNKTKRRQPRLHCGDKTFYMIRNLGGNWVGGFGVACYFGSHPDKYILAETSTCENEISFILTDCINFGIQVLEIVVSLKLGYLFW